MIRNFLILKKFSTSAFQILFVQTGDDGSETIDLHDKFNFIYGFFAETFEHSVPLPESGKYN